MNCQVCLGIWILSLATLARAASVPNPKVIGPIPADVAPGDPSHDYPFFSTTADLAGYGYVEEEFFFEGTASRYNEPAGAAGTIIDSGHPYRTRMIVRRPAWPAQFNGTVVLEWLNVTANNDMDLLWVLSCNHFLRRGYAWIGVSAQQAGVHNPATGLKAWSPSRYGTLDLTEAGAILNDALSFDIYSQAAQAVRSPRGVDPMAGLPVERVLAAGLSQSAGRLVRYHNSIQPLAGLVEGFLVVSGGNLLRTDLDAKVIKLMSETDVAADVAGLTNQAALRQPDSDHLRWWEVAGTSHLGFREVEDLMRLQVRDGARVLRRDCGLEPLSRIPFSFVMNAAYDHMVRWIKHNIEPPTAPKIEVIALGPPVAVARDSFGNVLGGIRLAQHAVPTATNTGINSGPGFCPLFGFFQPFDAATLDALYQDYQTYIVGVIEAALTNLRDGFIMPEDAVTTFRDAAYSDIGRR